MKILYTTIAFLFLFQVKAQQADTSGITTDFIYEFMDMVIKRDSLLNPKYGISSKADFYMLEDKLLELINDTNAIKIEEKTDSVTITSYDSSLAFTGDSGKIYFYLPNAIDYNITASIGIDDKYNSVSLSDKKYMLAQINSNRNFVWDKKRLKMSKRRTKYFYTLSTPLFSSDKKQALITRRLLCPGLCGSGSIYLYTKTDDGWEYTTATLWMH